MSATLGAWAAALTVAIVLAYEIGRAVAQRRAPERLAPSAHAQLREEWLRAVSAHPGSEILAVQTLRNSVMSATMTASTAMLGLIGSVTLAAPTLHGAAADGGWGALALTPRLALELVLMAQLLASLVASTMAVRYYNHVGFVAAMPVGSPERARWGSTGVQYVRRAGLLYGWGLRHLVLVAPALAAIVHPLAGPVTAVVVVAALVGFDRFDGQPREH